MTQPPRPARRLGRLVTCLLAAAGLAAAWAQPIADATKTYYVGTLTSEAGAAEPVLLDLSLYQDGFAFGRLQLAGRHEVLHGGGTLRDGTLLRLTLAPAPWPRCSPRTATTTGPTRAAPWSARCASRAASRCAWPRRGSRRRRAGRSSSAA